MAPVDRASFLTLTFGMAGIGCNGGPGPIVAGSSVEIPAQPSASAPMPRVVAPPHAAPAKPDASTLATATDEPPDEPDEDELAADAGLGACGWVEPASVTRPSSSCAEDVGAVPACTAMRACSGVTFPKMKCEAFRKYFKARVAQRALACLAKLSDKQVCDACNPYRCGELALKTACPDSAADATCMQIAHSCRAVAMSECQTYLSGMNAAGRAKIAGCLSSAPGCGFGIFSCTEGLF